MAENQEPVQALAEIRNMMERSSKFISLSGLSGVFAGVFALAGAVIAYYYLGIKADDIYYYEYARSINGGVNYSFYYFFIIDAGAVLLASLCAGIYFTAKKAQRKGLSIWDSTAKRMLLHLFVPLATGGFFCLVLVYHGQIALVAPATLIFYGLALLNASKFTLHDIWYLGICEIALGLISSIYVGYGLIFWALGFGLLHILYGTIMYYKYER